MRTSARATASALRTMAISVPVLNWCGPGSDAGGGGGVPLGEEGGGGEGEGGAGDEDELPVAEWSASAAAELDETTRGAREGLEGPFLVDAGSVGVECGGEGDGRETVAVMWASGEVEGGAVDVAGAFGTLPAGCVACVAAAAPVNSSQIEQPPIANEAHGPFANDGSPLDTTEHQHPVSAGWHGIPPSSA